MDKKSDLWTEVSGFGTLTMYGDDNRIVGKALVCALNKTENSQRFIVIEPKYNKPHKNHLCSKMEVGTILVLSNRVTYYFEPYELYSDEYNLLFAEYLCVLEARSNSPVEITTSTGKKHILKATDIQSAEKWLFENHPDDYFGSTIVKKCVSSDFCLIPVEDYFVGRYGNIYGALMQIGKEKGFDTKEVEVIYGEVS